MMRTVGILMLSSGAAALGLAGVARLEGRVRDLSGLIAGLEGMRLALSSRLAPLKDMLSTASDISRGRARGIFQYCLTGLKDAAPRQFGALWYAALEELPLCLSERDLEIVCPLGRILGRYDGDTQLAELDQAISLLKPQLEDASERRRSLGKVYGVAGVSAGLLLIILLI